MDSFTHSFPLSGRVLFEFDCPPVVATIIYNGVFKRMPLATMLVEGDKHRNPAKVKTIAYII